MKKKKILVLAIFTTVVYIIWRIGWSLPFGYRAVDIGFAVILLLAELTGFFEAAMYLIGMSETKKTEKPEIPEPLYPEVDVFIATYNEAVALVEKTVNGCIHMDYPDKSKVHIYICDDNDRHEMAEAAKRLGVGYFRRTEHTGAKAGNLNHALRHTKSPLVATFDADMIPMHDFLTATVPYFFTDRYEKQKDGNWASCGKPGKKVGFVQTPQSFYNTDLFQYNLFAENTVPNEQNFFFRFIQTGRNRANAAIYAGSNTVLAREALSAAGGFYEKAITEDLATGLCIQAAGYQTFALSKVHASGLAPTDIKSLFKQRERWARGCIQTFRQLHLFTRKGVTRQQRLAYLSSLLYWYTPVRRVIFLAAPILFSVFRVYLLDADSPFLLLFWLPHYIFYTMALSRLSGEHRTVRLSNIYDTILAFRLIPGILLETFGIKKEKFEVTKKSIQTEEESIWERLRFALPQLLLIALSLWGIAASVRNMWRRRTTEDAVILFWLVSNLYSLCMAVFFLMGRRCLRSSERFLAEVPVTIRAEMREWKAVTRDISEGGISFDLERPAYIPEDEPLKVTISDEAGRYTSHLTGSVAHVRKVHEKWRYSIAFCPPGDREKQNLYLILYDRIPTLPAAVSRDSNFWGDLKNNILKRGQSAQLSDRRLPRVVLNRNFKTKQGERYRVINFNYKYVLIWSREEDYKKRLKLYDEEQGQPCFDCSLEKELQSGGFKRKKTALYALENETEFRYNEAFERQLILWEYSAGHK